jgi:Tol biopolymer transport system component
VGQIAYYTVNGPDGGGVYIVDLDGLKTVQVASRVSMPAWSPDGSKLLFSNTQCDTDWETFYVCEKGGLLLMDFATRQYTAPEKGALGEDPAWSPDGNQVAFVRYDPNRGRRLYVMRLDGSELREIPTPGVSEVFGPSWSPDGNKIAVQYEAGGMGIGMADADGSGFVKMSIDFSGQSMVSPSWSPDGSQIAFAILYAGKGTIALMSADGTGVVKLTDGFMPAWSHDGSKLAFTRNNEGLFIMDRDGSNVVRLVNGITGSPAWRP